MTPRIASSLLAILTASLAASALAQTIPPATSPAPATLPTTATAPVPLDPKWSALLSRLAADDFKTRNAAQKELAQLPYSNRPLLDRLAARTSDPEVKASLVARAQEMELDEAIDPGPISINLKNAPLHAIVAALNKAMGTAIEAWPPNDDSPRCTLQLTDQPFWDVYAAITHKIPLQFEYSDKLELTPTQPGKSRFVRARGLAIFPGNVTRTTVIYLQKRPADQTPSPELTFSCDIVADPRTKIAAASQPQWTQITDDLGNVLFQAEPENPNNLPDWWNTETVWSTSQSLKIPEHLGSKIASAKGSLRLLVALSTKSLEVAEFDKKFADPLSLGNYTLKVTKFEVKENAINFQIEVKSATPAPPGQEDARPPLTFIVTDAKNNTIMSQTLREGGCGGGCGVNAITKPLKLHLTCPDRIKDITIPFELKDLPLPD